MPNLTTSMFSNQVNSMKPINYTIILTDHLTILKSTYFNAINHTSNLTYLTTWLSLNQVISGFGSPDALQFRVTGSFLFMRTEFGCSMIRGGEYAEEEVEEEEDEDEVPDLSDGESGRRIKEKAF